MSDAENIVHIDDTEIKESDMTDKQKYLTKQLRDLNNQKARLEFQLDQVMASLSVFKNAFIETTKEVANEVLETETKTIGEE
jgi:hypothetical protein|tara:strand:- start:1936 stop:2181 length:246 start_codon:yes stop_codon:yes gene_type:complete